MLGDLRTFTYDKKILIADAILEIRILQEIFFFQFFLHVCI